MRGRCIEGLRLERGRAPVEGRSRTPASLDFEVLDRGSVRWSLVLRTRAVTIETRLPRETRFELLLGLRDDEAHGGDNAATIPTPATREVDSTLREREQP